MKIIIVLGIIVLLSLACGFVAGYLFDCKNNPVEKDAWEDEL